MNRRRNLAWLGGVTAATLASGWIGHQTNKARGEAGMNSPGAGIWIAAPLATVTAVRLLRRSRSSGHWNPRARPRWYVVATAAFPAVTAAALGIGRAMGWVDLSAMDLRRLVKPMATSFGPGMVKNVFEEAVWRGYFTDELVNRDLPDAAIYLGSGLVWTLWHVPYYLYFIPEDELREVFDVPRGVWALVAFVPMMAWVVSYTELYRLSGSVWPCVLMHTVEDTLNHLFIDGHARIAAGRDAVISPVVGVLPAALHLGAGLALRAIRKRTHNT